MMDSDVGGTLRYIIKIDDSDFQQGLNKTAKSVDDLADKMANGSTKASKALKNNIGNGASQAGQEVRKFVNDSIGALGELTTAIGKVSFNAFTTAAGAASTAMTALVTKGLNIGSSLEKNRLSFEALTGSVENSEKVLTAVADFASENPYQLLDVSNVARELVAMGRTADDVAPDLARLGAIGVATGADLGSLGHVYAQISAQGKMMTQDMYQLVNQGVAIMPALAKVTGKSMTELKDYISDGKVTMEVFTKAMGQIVDPEMYDNLLNKMNNTIPRQLDRLKGSISTFATSLVGIDKWTGQKLETGLAQTYTNILKKLADNLRNPKLIESVKRLGEAIAKMVDKFVPLIDKIAPALTKLFDTISDHTATLIPIVGGALVMFGRLGAGLPGIGGIIGNLSSSVSTLGKSFLKLFQVNPLLGVFVTMLGVGLPKALKNDAFRSSLKSIINSLARIGKALGPVIAKIGEAMAVAGSRILTTTLQALCPILEAFADIIESIPTPVLTALIEAIIGLLVVKKVTGPLKSFGTVLARTFSYFKSGGTILSTIGVFRDLLGSAKTATTAAKVATGTMQSVSKIGEAAQTAGNVMTRGQRFMKTMRQGIMNLILLAGAIAALGVALKFAYDSIPNDLGGLLAKLGVMTLVIGVMGGIAVAADKIKSINWKSIGLLASLAAPLATFAAGMWLVNKAIPDDLGSISAKLGILAGVIVAMGAFATAVGKIKSINAKSIITLTALAIPLVAFAGALWAVNQAVPDDLGGLSAKLGIMAGAMAGIGLIAGIAGKFKKDIAVGLVVVIGIAGTIALTALALQYTYNTMPSDFGGLQARIGSMALVIVEIGVLAGVVGALMMTGIGAAILAAGLVALIGIAGTLALVGVAMKSAYENLPSDFSGFQAKIGSLALVVGEIAGLSTALGIGQILSLGTMNLGLLTLVEIAWALAGAAIGIKTAAENMPSDMDAVKNKVEAGIAFLMGMKEKYGGSGGLLPAIANFFWNGEGTQQFDTFVEISRKLASTAENLSTLVDKMPDGGKLDGTIEKVQKAVEFLMKLKQEYSEPGGLLPTIGGFFWNGDSTKNFDVVNDIAKKLSELATNLENLSSVSSGKLARVVNGSLFSTLKSAVDTLKNEFGSDSGGLIPTLGSFFYNEDSTKALDNATKIAETLGKLVDNLAKIEDVSPSKLNRAISVTIPKLKEVVNKLKEEFTEHGGLFDTIGSWFSNDDSTAKLDKAKEIAEKLGGLVDNLGKIQDLDISKLNKLASDGEDNPIIKLKGVVSRIKSAFVDDADSVTNKLAEYNTGGLEKAQTVAENIKKISDSLSGVGDLKLNVPGIETFIANMKTIVSKIEAEFGEKSGFEGISKDTADSVTNVQTIASNLSQMSSDLKNIQDLSPEEINPKIDHIKTVMERLKQVFVADGQGEKAIDVSAFEDESIKNSVGHIQAIVTSLKTIATEAASLPDVPEGITGENGKIAKIHGLVKEIIWKFDATGDDVLDLSMLDVIKSDLAKVPEIINSLKAIATNVQDFPDAATGAENLKNFVGKLAAALKSLGTELVDSGVMDSMKVLGNNLIDNILQGFQEQFTANAPGKVTEFYNVIKNNIDNNKQNFIARGQDVGNWLTDGLKNGLEGQKGPVWESFRGVINNATNGDMKWVAVDQSKGIGAAMAQGVAAGLSAEIWRINYAVGNLSAAAISKLKSLLGIASPSKVFFGLGQYTGEGLALGLESQIESVGDAAQELADAIRSPFDQLDDFTASITGTGGQNGIGGISRNTTINQNNIINNGADYSTMMSDLKWALFTA